jgi:hypothetical protein
MRTDYTVGQNPPNSNTRALQSKLCILKSDAPRYGAPESLYDVLSDDNSQRFRLLQTFRIILAKLLATSLLYLRSTGWLHNGIRSQNVLVLGSGDRRSPSAISKLIEEPHLVGHARARSSE